MRGEGGKVGWGESEKGEGMSELICLAVGLMVGGAVGLWVGVRWHDRVINKLLDEAIDVLKEAERKAKA